MNDLQQIAPGVFVQNYDLDARFTRGSLEGLAGGVRDAVWNHFEIFQSVNSIRVFAGGNWRCSSAVTRLTGEELSMRLLPVNLVAPPVDWQTSFRALAEECGLYTDIATVFETVRKFFENALAGGIKQ